MIAQTTRSLRVARIIARLNVGGPARHVVWLTAEMAAEGFETLLVTGTVAAGESDMSDFAAMHGVAPVVIPEMSRELSPRDVITIVKLWSLMRRFRPDIVHTHTAKAGAAGRLAAFLYRWLTLQALLGRPRPVRVVHTYHGHVFHGYYGALRTRVFLAIERQLARISDAIVVLAEQQLREIHERFAIGRREQFRIIPLGINFEESAAAPQAEPHQGSVVGIVGRLTAIKDHRLFLRVATRLQHRADVSFAVYGDGEDRDSLRATAAELGLERVAFYGTRPASEIYAAIDLIALTSRNEGTPLALIEAMANGVPVLSAAVGGVVDLLGPVTETVTEGRVCYDLRERGVTARSGDEEGLAAGLGRLLDDPELRELLRSRGRAFVTAKHSLERLVHDVASLYRELQGSPRLGHVARAQ